jgi:predicted pyridoxine 5'-phosphate oxidase superfamily flavin-nucleotide-binding protein
VSAGPFHHGELEAQRLAGGGAEGGGIRGAMVEQQRLFFASLPFVVVGGRDAGWPVATLLAGAPGFVRAPDARTLHIRARVDASDPAAPALVAGAPVGLLGIVLATRRRNRANGVVGSVNAGGLTLSIHQSFGNCPKYIHPREVRAAPTEPRGAERLSRLDEEAREAIARADTFFVASAARVGEERGGVDVSHRGGPAGFVRLEGDTLTIPDYQGNRYFNTLGNLVSEPRAALLFVDFARGDLLHLQGETEIVWSGVEVRAHVGAERLWRLHVRAAVRRPGAVGLRWD